MEVLEITITVIFTIICMLAFASVWTALKAPDHTPRGTLYGYQSKQTATLNESAKEQLQAAQNNRETLSSIITFALREQCAGQVDDPEGSVTVKFSKTMARKLQRMAEELERQALPTIVTIHGGQSDGSCWIWCGENYCDDNGCTNRERHDVDSDAAQEGGVS